MTRLSTHLRHPENHGRLRFHPSCPICRRERLGGTLPTEALVSRRMQACLAGGVLVLSTAAAPVVALAAEQESEREGTVAPEQTPAQDPQATPDPGGPPTQLATDPSETPENDPNVGQEPQMETAPQEDPQEQVADPGDPPDPVATAPAPATPAPVTPAPGAPAPPPAEQAAQQVPPPAPLPAPAPAAVGSVKGKTVMAHAKERPVDERVSGMESPQPTTVVRAQAEAAPQSQPQRAPESVPPKEATRSGGHVVVSGESLWSIATTRLGANASPGAVAREVNRIWAMNSERIGTGDPDLLMVGTALRLS